MKRTLSTSSAAKSKAKHDPAIGAVIELLAETFPACFAIFEQRRRPLKIGIHHDVLAALDGVITQEELSRALAIYAANKWYREKFSSLALCASISTAKPQASSHRSRRCRTANPH